MKTKTNILLLTTTLIGYWAGLCNASAFYDPGAQKWLNRDPAENLGFLTVKHPKQLRMLLNYKIGSIINADATYFYNRILVGKNENDINPYEFVQNQPVGKFDLLGLDYCDENLKRCDEFASDPVSGVPTEESGGDAIVTILALLECKLEYLICEHHRHPCPNTGDFPALPVG